VDGFLVGGASLKAEFKDIVSAVAKAKGQKRSMSKGV
jgi:triosephosphate isomerase